MAGPALPVTIDSSYSNSNTDSTVQLHQQHHDALHRVVNTFDSTITAARSGDVLTWNGTVYVPAQPAGAGATGGGSANTLAVNNRTGAYTLTLSDAGGLITLTSSSAVTLTIPSNSSVPFAIGTQIHVGQFGSGQVRISPGSGVTVNGAPGLKLVDQYSGADLIKRAVDTWWVVGRLTA
jgi:hypothetical protein